MFQVRGGAAACGVAVLTEAELLKYKESPKRNLFAKMEDMSVEPHVGSDQEYGQQIPDASVDKVPLRGMFPPMCSSTKMID